MGPGKTFRDSYAFPSVEVSGTMGEVTAVINVYVPKDYEKLAYRRPYEVRLENGAWYIVARPDQVEAFSGGGQTPTSASGSASASASAP
jgi:hypothetical protein